MAEVRDSELHVIYEDKYSALIALASYANDSSVDAVEVGQQIDLPDFFAPEPVPSTFTLAR